MQFPFITVWYGACYNIQTTVYRHDTNIEQMYVYASEWISSELRKFWHFYILKLLFLSDILLDLVQMACLSKLTCTDKCS